MRTVKVNRDRSRITTVAMIQAAKEALIQRRGLILTSWQTISVNLTEANGG